MRFVLIPNQFDHAHGVQGFSGGNAHVSVAQGANEIADGAVNTHGQNLSDLGGYGGDLAFTLSMSS